MSDRDTIVSVDALSKRYRLAVDGGRPNTLRDAVAMRARDFRRHFGLRRPKHDVEAGAPTDFWALQDLSFEVARGQVLGIIGRNGAGKSTLLKILSRITEPTAGQVRMSGRVASLLEVGTGFHAELTGRENIFLNGAILGMSRQEIKAKFDEIVAFAEVDRFLDTPVKRYSSGMYVKLAFAVAAHLEPEILIIDEVLAVGDIVFQRKCLGKLRDVAKSGRTVLFVSHNLSAVAALTERALLLEQGRLVMSGGSREVVSRYLQGALDAAGAAADVSAYRRSVRTSGHVDFSSLSICGLEPGLASVGLSQSLTVDLGVQVLRPIERATLVINILNEQTEVLASLMSADAGVYFSLDPGAHILRCQIPALPLVPGSYRISVGITQSNNALAWDVLEAVPGFRLDAEQHPAWLEASDREGVLLLDGCTWKEC